MHLVRVTRFRLIYGEDQLKQASEFLSIKLVMKRIKEQKATLTKLISWSANDYCLSSISDHEVVVIRIIVQDCIGRLAQRLGQIIRDSER